MKANLFLPLSLVLLLAGCTSGDSASTPPGGASSAGPGGAAAAPAADDAAAVRARMEEFVAAAQAGDRERTLASMTAKARTTIQQSEGTSINPPEGAEMTYGEPQIDGGEARILVTMKGEEGDEPVTFLLRKEEGLWLVYGMSAPSPFEPGTELTINLEAPGEGLGGLAQGVAEGLAEGMQEAFEDAFDPAKMAARAAEEARAKAEAILNIAPVDVAAFEAAWRVDFDTVGRPATEVLDDLAARMQVAIDRTAADAAALAESLNDDLRGQSLLEALEAAAAAVGSYSQFPDPSAMGSFAGPQEGEQPTVTLVAGSRPLPVVFAGPFALEVRALHEHPPYGTGMLSVGVFAYALSPAARKALEDAEPVAIAAVAAAAGSDLRDDSIGGFSMSPALGAGSYATAVNVPLRGLLRSMSQIDVVVGAATMSLPAEVATGEFADLTPATSIEVGGAQIKLDSSTPSETNLFGEPQKSVQLSFTWTGLPAEQVQFVALDAAGELLPSNRLFSSGFGDQASAAIDVTGDPARVVVKAITRVESLRYDFELTGLPLPQSAQQPEEVAAAEFAGEAPATVEYLGLGGEEGFRKLKVRITNHADQPIRNLEMRVTLLGADGQELENSPNSHSGSTDFETGRAEPIVEAGGAAEVELMAFFMPDETKDVRIAVVGAQFANATRWQAE